MGSAIALRPIHYASVSGGKDSLYMMKVILANPQKYPLDMVVNFDLEIEPPEAHVVADKIREMCERIKIPFWSIKPRRSFDELCGKWGMPTMMGRWCNSDYKMDCDAQLRKWIREQNCRPVAYIGICADEKHRHRYDIGTWNDGDEQSLCYPLAEEGIEEEMILSWAKEQPIFNGFYLKHERMGCEFCPNMSMMDRAMFMMENPERYEYYREKILDFEQKKNKPWLRNDGDYWPVIERKIKRKYIPKVLNKFPQMKCPEQHKTGMLKWITL